MKLKLIIYFDLNEEADLNEEELCKDLFWVLNVVRSNLILSILCPPPLSVFTYFCALNTLSFRLKIIFG